ncbi:hypothetical protein RHMOL_Rhmol06G0131100 [Rhododendron molle]|uniref:Uncharacterized protein n=1 Tax=Rhododendron molle TaxID=49168 RepID=A0ACC0NBW9_RHOML|nr:hypothetical protein RHMOL_Rhmol06G0131100 [Rhododendron molle]
MNEARKGSIRSRVWFWEIEVQMKHERIPSVLGFGFGKPRHEALRRFMSLVLENQVTKEGSEHYVGDYGAHGQVSPNDYPPGVTVWGPSGLTIFHQEASRCWGRACSAPIDSDRARLDSSHRAIFRRDMMGSLDPVLNEKWVFLVSFSAPWLGERSEGIPRSLWAFCPAQSQGSSWSCSVHLWLGE